jgi:molybdopterin/thiamine biosynthesis adenylyltransferase
MAQMNRSGELDTGNLMMSHGRLERQLRIEGWNQNALENAKIGVVGDDDQLASLYILSASALGINKLVVLSPALTPQLVETAEKLNPRFNLVHIEGFYTHPVLDEIFDGCNLFVDLSHYGLCNKLLLEKACREGVPVVRGFCFELDGEQGFKVFTYLKGREWQELYEIISDRNLPGSHFEDGVLGNIVAGIALEETKALLMGGRVSDEIISYRRKKLSESRRQPNLLVVGAGALGVFVGLGLAFADFKRVTFIDSDNVDVTNLNRQVFFHDAVGTSKAHALSSKLNQIFDMETMARLEDFTRGTAVSSYDAIFDCVDNFETRIILSETCKHEGKVLVSGGTSAEAGQAVIFNPVENGLTPAELLGFSDIVRNRQVDTLRRAEASCSHQPDPSVVMTNQITAGFMVDAYRVLLSGQRPKNIFYHSTSPDKILTGERNRT